MLFHHKRRAVREVSIPYTAVAALCMCVCAYTCQDHTVTTGRAVCTERWWRELCQISVLHLSLFCFGLFFFLFFFNICDSATLKCVYDVYIVLRIVQISMNIVWSEDASHSMRYYSNIPSTNRLFQPLPLVIHRLTLELLKVHIIQPALALQLGFQLLSPFTFQPTIQQLSWYLQWQFDYFQRLWTSQHVNCVQGLNLKWKMLRVPSVGADYDFFF